MSGERRKNVYGCVCCVSSMACVCCVSSMAYYSLYHTWPSQSAHPQLPPSNIPQYCATPALPCCCRPRARSPRPAPGLAPRLRPATLSSRWMRMSAGRRCCRTSRSGSTGRCSHQGSVGQVSGGRSELLLVLCVCDVWSVGQVCVSEGWSARQVQALVYVSVWGVGGVWGDTV